MKARGKRRTSSSRISLARHRGEKRASHELKKMKRDMRFNRLLLAITHVLLSHQISLAIAIVCLWAHLNLIFSLSFSFSFSLSLTLTLASLISRLNLRSVSVINWLSLRAALLLPFLWKQGTKMNYISTTTATDTKLTCCYLLPVTCYCCCFRQ